MPVYLDKDPSNRNLSSGTRFKLASGCNGSATSFIHIGLINSMPDGALEATERQFLNLLNLASDDIGVLLSFYALPDVLRSDAGWRHVSRCYSGIENLFDTRLDGLIVTGAEPRAPSLTDEPYWESMTRVVQWAKHNTSSTVWSCLAAHAAVLHADGIGRRRLSDKRCGVLECARTSDHILTARVPTALRVPHSRWNDIGEDDLTDCGYDVLTRSRDGVDTFVKPEKVGQRKSLFVFFQGHPEYDANTLLLEYRRDVARYLRRERDTYPIAPLDYFDGETAARFAALRERAPSYRGEDLMREFESAAGAGKSIANTWQPAAVYIYANWLSYLHSDKEHRRNHASHLGRSAAQTLTVGHSTRAVR